jgi:hypothetical protein
MKRKRIAPSPLTEQEKQLREFFGGRLTAKERESFAAQTEEEREMLLGGLRAINRPWDLWEAEVRKRRDRGRGLESTNDDRRRKAERDHEKYRDTAEMLIARNPELGGATRNRLAKEVQAEWVKQGRGVVTVRTIWEALGPKNKV